MKHEWDHVQQILESRLNPGLYKVWIKPLSGKVNGKVLELTAPNGFVASWVRDRLLDSIEDATCFALGQDMKVCIQTAAPRLPQGKPKRLPHPNPPTPNFPALPAIWPGAPTSYTHHMLRLPWADPAHTGLPTQARTAAGCSISTTLWSGPATSWRTPRPWASAKTACP